MTHKVKQTSILILTLVCIISLAGLFGGCTTAAGDQTPVQPGNNASDQVDPTSEPAGEPAGEQLDGKLKVSYIDVGQGDAIFMELPNGKSMLIDAGNPSDGSIVVSYIKHEGVSKIDYLVATHPHSDHIGGLPQVISTFDIGSIYMSKVSTTTKVFENLLTSIENKGLKINTAKAGVNILHEGNLRVDILAPVSASYSDLNNYSVVVKVVYGASSFLFMGDAEKLSENQITADVNADVLKVGHHGSEYSSGKSFIDAVSPEISVISVGAGNQYGHPYSGTLNTLLGAGSKVYRTDLDGTIVFVSDGTKITVSKHQ